MGLFRSARAAGWRAGRCGAHYFTCPFASRPLLAWAWRAGWQKGIHERLAEWLEKRRA